MDTDVKIKQIKNELAQLMQIQHANVENILNQDIPGLSRKERDKLVFQLPEMPDSLMDMIKEADGFMTGSRVFGENYEFSDADWCVNIPAYVFDGYVLGIRDTPDYIDANADTFKSLLGHKDDIIINIICFGSYDLCEAWKETTRIMKLLRNTVNSLDFDTKWKRVRVFRALCDTLYEAPELHKFIPREDAIKYNKCCFCGQEAVSFTTKDKRDIWKRTGTCERCQ